MSVAPDDLRARLDAQEWLLTTLFGLAMAGSKDPKQALVGFTAVTMTEIKRLHDPAGHTVETASHALATADEIMNLCEKLSQHVVALCAGGTRN